jgi:hypothetical protein
MGIEGSRSAFSELATLPVSDRILALYELGIQACAEGVGDRVAAVLVELMETLDFDYGEIAEAFYRLYDFCLERTRDGDLAQVAWTLGDLRDAWREAAGARAERAARTLRAG